jgi:hypothetical protein
MELSRFDFQGDEILWFEADGRKHIVCRRICEALGIGWAGQATKLTQSIEFRSHIRRQIISTPGGRQEMIGIDFEWYPQWINSISVEKVSPDRREKLLLFKRESSQALHQYWQGSGIAINPRLATSELHPDVQAMLQISQALLATVQAMFAGTQQTLTAMKQDIASLAQQQQLMLPQGNISTQYISILGYSRKQGRTIPLNVANVLGSRAARICRHEGIVIGRVPDERWGEVNTYPEEIVADVWRQLIEEAS